MNEPSEPIIDFLDRQESFLQDCLEDCGEETRRECAAHYAKFRERIVAIDARYRPLFAALSRDRAEESRGSAATFQVLAAGLQGEMNAEIWALTALIENALISHCNCGCCAAKERVQ